MIAINSISRRQFNSNEAVLNSRPIELTVIIWTGWGGVGAECMWSNHTAYSVRDRFRPSPQITISGYRERSPVQAPVAELSLSSRHVDTSKWKFAEDFAEIPSHVIRDTAVEKLTFSGFTVKPATALGFDNETVKGAATHKSVRAKCPRFARYGHPIAVVYRHKS